MRNRGEGGTGLGGTLGFVAAVAAVVAAGALVGCGSGDPAPPEPDITSPSVPAGLVATVFGDSVVNLAWTASSDNVTPASGLTYGIWLSPIVSVSTARAPDFTTAAGATTYSVRGLVSSVSYYFVIQAIDAAGNASADSSEVTETTTAPNFTHVASTVIGDADWTDVVPTVVQFGEAPYRFVPQLSSLTFPAGTPVILRVERPVSNFEMHHFGVPAATPDADNFFKNVAWRKAQTSQAEYKAPYFEMFEFHDPGTYKFIDLYFVPVVPGAYILDCDVGNHSVGGMAGTIFVTGTTAALDQEVDTWWAGSGLDADARRSDDDPVWVTAQEVQVDMVENVWPPVAGGDLAFSTTPRYAVDQAYVLKLTNPAGAQSKHYYSAPDFFRTCVLSMVEDEDCEIIAPYLTAVELLYDPVEDKGLEMYIVPTVAGSYAADCTVTTPILHSSIGMTHTFTVDAAGTTASSLVAAASWPGAPTHTVTMVENWPTLSFSPADLTFPVGQPVILRIINPAGNASMHSYVSSEFYKTVAWRKAQTTQAEYKAPYFKAFTMEVPGSSDAVLDLYFIPQIPGKYEVECEIPGHVAPGMTGTITVTGNAANSLDLEVSPTWDRDLDSDPRTSGSHAVWNAPEPVQIDMVETIFPSVLSFSLTPRYLTDESYVVTIKNPLGNQSKHYYSAPLFNETCVLLKTRDVDAEITAPYLNAVELLFDDPAMAVDKSMEMYIVPTAAGSYDADCTLAGHVTAGMTHTFTVAAGASFATDVLPIFSGVSIPNNGPSPNCTGCHSSGGPNNLDLDSYANVMLGASTNGPVVIGGNGPGSIIYRKAGPDWLTDPQTFGGRMPLGNTTYFDTNSFQRERIRRWIDEGALDN